MTSHNLRIFGVNEHPHDFTHYAGTLGIHSSMGDEVTIVSVTSGASTHNEKLRDESRKPPEERDQDLINDSTDKYAAQKKAEFLGAASLFGISDVRMLSYPDKPFNIERYPEAIEELRDILLEIRPHLMITQSPFTTGRHGMAFSLRDDHTEVANASLEAMQRAAIPRPGDDRPQHRIASVMYPGIYFDRSQIDFVVEISEDWYEKRVEAEAMYESQGHTVAYARRRIGTTVGHTGLGARTPYGEAFVRHTPELVSHIIIPEPVLQLAEDPTRHRRAVEEQAARSAE